MTSIPPIIIQPAFGLSGFLRRSAALAVASLALTFSSGTVAEGVSVKETARMAGVLDLIDLDRSGLEEVRAASEQGAPLAAMEALLTYYRNREMDYHFDASSMIRDLPGEDDHLHDPMVVPSVRGMPVGVHDTTTPEDALERKLTFLSNTVAFCDEVDWRHQETDREWNFMLGRHTYFLTLTEAYRRSGDERYMAELAERFREWDRQVEPEFPRRLDVGIRTRHWVWLYPVAVQSEHFDAELLTIFLESLHQTCEWLNARGPSGYGGSNQGAMEAVGVLHAATYFPEFTQARAWRDSTVERMKTHLFDSTFADGVYHGRSPTYHNVTLREMNWFYQLMLRAGAQPPEGFAQRFHQMIDFAAAFTRPDLTIPQFGHTDRDYMVDRLSRWGRQANRPDVVFIGTGGEEGSMPDWQGKVFPQGKFALLRSGWEDGDQARWGMLDYGPRGRGADRTLSVDLFAYGQPMIVAPGRYTYAREDRSWFHYTRFQNTVSIDGKNMNANPKSGLARQKIDGNLQVLHAWHDGYSQLVEGGGERSVVHERQVVMVRDRYWIVADLIRVKGGGEFTFDQNWRFLPTELRRIDDYPNALVTGYEESNLAIVPLAGEGKLFEEEAWYSPKYGVKYPAPRLSYRHRTANGWFFVTLLAPYKGEEQPLAEMEIQANGNSVEGQLSWDDRYVDAIGISFGENRGEGETRWKGWRHGKEIGEEVVE